MKILLAACNAKYIHSNLAVFNLKACAKEYDSNVVLREYTINQQKDDILKDIYRCHPDVICISCYIWNSTFVRELMQDLRKILTDVPFWAVGPEVSYDAEVLSIMRAAGAVLFHAAIVCLLWTRNCVFATWNW